jgi:hypothetical protein
MSRIYIAAPYGNKGYACEVRNRLQILGHTVTSRWLDEPPGGASVPDDPVSGARCAQDDLDDINTSDTLLLLTDSQIRGTGHHVETGYAIAKGLRILQCGPVTSVFQYLFDTGHNRRFATIEAALDSGAL